jgi:DNA-binding HxlR family transcriptional regulator
MKNNKTHDKSSLCPAFAHTSRLIGDKWVTLIVHELLIGPRRFNELQNAVVPSVNSACINSRTLTLRLKSLEEDGIISRTVFEHAKPPRVEYTITKKGQDLSEIIEHMRAYGKKHLMKG